MGSFNQKFEDMKSIVYTFIILSSLGALAQQKINWIDFKDLPCLQVQNPKPMFIYIFADWCVYCKKMERVTFKDKDNIELLNNNYYALKFNLETEERLVFNDKIFDNTEHGNRRNPKHDLAKYLTGKDEEISLPAVVILDSDFNILAQLHTYLSPKQLNLLINQ